VGAGAGERRRRGRTARAGLARWAFSEAATGASGRPIDNFVEVRHNWDALVTAYELAYGTIRLADTSSDAIKISRQFSELVWRIVLRGVVAVKDWCHARRTRACGARPLVVSTRRFHTSFGRGTAPEQSMIASGLDRAWVHVASERDKQEAKEAAFERLTAPKLVLNSDKRRDLMRFVERIAQDGRPKAPVSLPGPQGTAAAGYGVRV